MSILNQAAAMRPVDVRYRTMIHEISKDWHMENHYHNDYELIFILEGKIELKINHTTYILEKNSLVFINNMEQHGYRVLEYPYKRYVIMMKPDFLQSAVNEPVLTSIFQLRPDHFNHLLNVPEQEVSNLSHFFNCMYRESKGNKDFRDTNLKLLLYQLLISIYRISNQHFPMANLNKSMNQLITSIQNYIEEHYMEDLSLKDISKLFYTDMYYLCHIFKNVTGSTFKSYLIKQRISKAKDLLAYTEDHITQVGFDCGFNNINHFIRTFKKMLGITPHQYRKKCKDTSTF